MKVLGTILGFIGFVLLFARSNQKGRLFELRTVEERGIADLLEVQQAVAAEIGAGAFEEKAAVRGVGEPVAGAGPLVAPLSGESCLYYEVRVTLEARRDVPASGNAPARTEQVKHELIAQRRDEPFELVEGAARLRVRPEGARYEGLVDTVVRFHPWSPGAAPREGSISAPPVVATAGETPVGYRFHERVLRAGIELTAVGQVSDAGGGVLQMRRGPDGLLVSPASRAALIVAARAKVRSLSIAAGVLLAAGAAAWAYALVG
jgi:hypothetical protein